MPDNKARRRRKIFNPRGANKFENDAKDPDRTQEKSIPCKGCFSPRLEGNTCRQVWTPDTLKLFRARMLSIPFGEINFNYDELTMGPFLQPVDRHTPESWEFNAAGDGWKTDDIAERHQIFHNKYLDGIIPWALNGDVLLTFNGDTVPNCDSGIAKAQAFNANCPPIAESTITVGDFDGPVPPPTMVGTAQSGDEANFPVRITGVKYVETLQATSNWGFGANAFSGGNGGYGASTRYWHTGSFEWSILSARYVAGAFGTQSSIQFDRVTRPLFHNSPEITFTAQLASSGNPAAYYQQSLPLTESLTPQPGNGWGGSYFDSSIGVGGPVNVDVSARGSGGNEGVDVIRLGPF